MIDPIPRVWAMAPDVTASKPDAASMVTNMAALPAEETDCSLFVLENINLTRSISVLKQYAPTNKAST